MAQKIPEIPGYQILRQLGSGGMATVYLAVQSSLERKVAIKVLRNTAEDDPERTEKRFLREGRTLAKITHRNVCGIYDIAKVNDIAYIAMEYLDGGTLVDKLRVGVSVGESISIVVQLASALEEAHKLGIIHRDLKPANVMLRGGKVPVLTDFGIARELTAAQTRITAENMIVGTPIYMSPEQVSGGEVDGRSDLYALGVMFFELLTGRPPFKGETPIAVCMQHLTAPIPRLGEDLADLQPVLDAMLAKRREDRYASMTEFTRALRDVFVASEPLRRVARFSPDQPWSEQLRELGFSFDTMRDAEVKSAMDAARRRERAARAGAAGAVAAAPRAADAAAATRHSRPRALRLPWLFAGFALLAAIAVGAYLWTQRGPSGSELVALNLLQEQFTERLTAGQLFVPERASASASLQEMRGIRRNSDYTLRAEETLAKAALAEVDEALRAGDIPRARSLLAYSGEILPEHAMLAAMSSRIAEEEAAIGQQQLFEQRLARLGALLDGERLAPGENLLDAFLAVRAFDAADPRVQDLARRVQRSVLGAVEAQVAANNLDAAESQALALAAAFPSDAGLAQRAAQLGAQRRKLERDQAVRQWRAQLADPAFDINALAAAQNEWRRLAELGLTPTEAEALTQELAETVARQAEAARKADDLELAAAWLAQAGTELSQRRPLAALAAQISAARAAEAAAATARAEKERQGQLVVDATPWAEVVALSNAAGEAIALPQDRATPLLLTLAEGRYQVSVAADGRRAQATVEVQRGRLSNVKLDIGGFDADRYLKEAGW